jgi:hypothetical protein
VGRRRAALQSVSLAALVCLPMRAGQCSSTLMATAAFTTYHFAVGPLTASVVFPCLCKWAPEPPPPPFRTPAPVR